MTGSYFLLQRGQQIIGICGALPAKNTSTWSSVK